MSKIIEGRFAVKGDRQPVIKSWLGLFTFLAAIVGQVLLRLHH